MEPIVSPPFASRDEAEATVRLLRGRGIPDRAISVVDNAFAEHLSLGAGVDPSLTEALLERNVAAQSGAVYVSVDTGGDILNESAALEVFGYMA